MLLAPFVLTIGLGFVTGRLSNSSSSGISSIRVILVNRDQAQLGNALVRCSSPASSTAWWRLP